MRDRTGGPRAAAGEDLAMARHERIRTLFDAYLDCPPEARNDWLAGACGDDVSLRDEVASLAQALVRSGDRLEVPAIKHGMPAGGVAVPRRDDRVGTQVGAWRLVRLIAHGGMGAVYEGERADGEFRQRVAVKLPRLGVVSAREASRLQHERAILARLHHRNIAALYDGGVLPDGQPWFVMEYVDGVPVTTYAEQQRLSIAERVQLTRQVCRAVQYAHEHQVVHRDLKPGNILVTADGTVKLLDFGIARLLESAEGAVPATQGADRAMTLEYASPEQVTGRPVSIGSDVYSLGLILHELITGRRASELGGLAIAEAVRRIAEVNVQRPSDNVDPALALALGVGVAALRRGLRGELDDITMMALRKEPERRYPSVDRLAQDLAAWEQGRPVTATADTLTYVLRKFIARHRWESAAAALVVLSLMVGAGATWWQWRRAEARYRDGRRLASALLSEVHAAIVDLPGATAARAALVRPTLEYLDRTARGVSGDPTLDLELAFAYQRVGDVQGNPTNANLGDVAGARRSYGKAIEIAERLHARHPEQEAPARLVALVSERLADVGDSAGTVRVSMEHQERAVQTYTDIAARWPGAEATHLLAVSQVKRGDLAGHPAFRNLGDTAAAMSAYRLALGMLERNAAVDRDAFRNLRYRALVFERMGRIASDGGWDDAAAMLEQSLALREQLADRRPGSAEARRDVAIAHFLLCGLYLQRQALAEATRACDASLAIRESLYRADPTNVQLVRGMGLIHRRRGDILSASGDQPQARLAWRLALGYYATLVERGAATTGDIEDRTALGRLVGGPG